MLRGFGLGKQVVPSFQAIERRNPCASGRFGLADFCSVIRNTRQQEFGTCNSNCGVCRRSLLNCKCMVRFIEQHLLICGFIIVVRIIRNNGNAGIGNSDRIFH